MRSFALLGLVALTLVSCTSYHRASRTDRVDSSPQVLGSDGKPRAMDLGPPTYFHWPVGNTKVLGFFGWRQRNKMHEGIDIAAGKGTPVMAAAAGRVLFVGRSIRGFGKLVVIRHPNDWSTVYAHLSRFDVREGQSIEDGEVLGLSGATGHARGAHLHFEIRHGADPLDPLLFLKKRH